MALFAVALTFVDDEERRLQVRPTHREYLQTLLDAGKLHESGPYTDDSGALLIYDAESEADVRKLLAD
ncbi:MAG: YciI family protein, partial [Chloroflexota bacterium]|nr:YciI family protein [Chloroflexota bacterium]